LGARQKYGELEGESFSPFSALILARATFLSIALQVRMLVVAPLAIFAENLLE